MIRYDLICKDEHRFEGWFRDSAGFEVQNNAGDLACPQCGSNRIEKALMAPGLAAKANSRNATDLPAENSSLTVQDKKAMAFRQVMRAMRSQVEANADYVGDRFAEEARRIYYAEPETGGGDDSAGKDEGKDRDRPNPTSRGIYGEATLEDAKALHEEGITVLPLPVLPEDQN